MDGNTNLHQSAENWDIKVHTGNMNIDMLLDICFRRESITSKTLDTDIIPADTWLTTFVSLDIGICFADYTPCTVTGKRVKQPHLFLGIKPNAGTITAGSIGYKVFRLIKRSVIGRPFNLGQPYYIYETAVTCEDWINWILPILQNCRYWYSDNNAPGRDWEAFVAGKLESDEIMRSFWSEYPPRRPPLWIFSP